MEKLTIRVSGTSDASDAANAPDALDPPTNPLARFLELADTDCVLGQSAQQKAIASTKPVCAPPDIPYPQHPDLMLPAAAAAYLGVETSTLAVWRCTKRYPLPFIKVGRLVYYRKSALDIFLVARTVDMDE